MVGIHGVPNINFKWRDFEFSGYLDELGPMAVNRHCNNVVWFKYFVFTVVSEELT